METGADYGGMTREAWLAARRTGYGGSDAARIVSGKLLEVYEDKLGLAEPKPETQQMKWGKILEPVIAEVWAKENGFELFKGPFLRDPANPLFCGTPDYLLKDPQTGQIVAGAEIKALDRFAAQLYGDEDSDEVRLADQVQGRWYIPIARDNLAPNLTTWYLIVLLGGNDLRTYRLERDPDVENQLRGLVAAFHERYVLPKVTPPMDGSQAATDFIKRRYPLHSEIIVQADEGWEQVLRDAFALRNQYEPLKEQYEAVCNQLRAYIGEQNAAGISGIVGQITWKKSRDSTVPDEDAMMTFLIETLAAEHGQDPAVLRAEVKERFMKLKPGYRSLRWKENK